MSRAKVAFILVLSISLILSFIPFVLPIPSTIVSPLQFRFDIAVLVFLSFERVGVGFLFLLGLKSFKTEFKHVYYHICAGAIIYGIFSLPYPISRYMNEWNNWYTLVASDIPTTVGFILLYVGVYKYGRILNVRNFYMLYKQFLPILLVILAVLWILPHRTASTTELEFDLVQSIYMTEAFLSFLSAGLVNEIRKVTNSTYSHALLWFFFAMVLDGIACVYYLTYNYLVFPTWIPEETLAVPFIISGFMFLIAGYRFNTMTTALPVKSTKENSTIDIIVYTASLASKLQDINAYLEPMRFITAKLEKGQQPSPDQEQELAKVYQNIEDYLVTKEPLKNYTKEGLRADIVSKFGKIPS